MHFFVFNFGGFFKGESKSLKIRLSAIRGRRFNWFTKKEQSFSFTYYDHTQSSLGSSMDGM